MNTSEEIWGPDGLEFKFVVHVSRSFLLHRRISLTSAFSHLPRPERWLQPLVETTNELCPFWSHQATFLSGPRFVLVILSLSSASHNMLSLSNYSPFSFHQSSSCIGYRFALAEYVSSSTYLPSRTSTIARLSR